FRHAIAFGVELEVVDQRFHRALHLAARGRHHLAIVGRYGATRHLLDALADDPHALAHLFHAADVTVETVAVPADRNVEIVLFVTVIGLRLAQIPGDAGAAQHHAREAPVQRVLGADDADIDVALEIDAVLGQQALDVVDDLEDARQVIDDVLVHALGHVLMHAAGTEI